MATYCLVDNCKHRSKRRSNCTTVDGKPLFRCKYKDTIITKQYDPDGDTPFDNNTICLKFEPIEE